MPSVRCGITEEAARRTNTNSSSALFLDDYLFNSTLFVSYKPLCFSQVLYFVSQPHLFHPPTRPPARLPAATPPSPLGHIHALFFVCFFAKAAVATVGSIWLNKGFLGGFGKRGGFSLRGASQSRSWDQEEEELVEEEDGGGLG